MKIINKTKKYLHVRLSKDEFSILEKAIKVDIDNRKKEQDRFEYAEWFYTNHVKIDWEDEYSVQHTSWKNIHNKKHAPEPDFYTNLYSYQFKDIINENKRKYKL